MPMVQTPIRVEREVLDEVDALATAESRTRANMLRVLIVEALAARKSAKGRK